MIYQHMPARLIHRDFFTSADLTDRPYWSQILWAGLIVFSDDSGVIRDDPVFMANTILSRNAARKCPSTSRIRAELELYQSRSMLQPELYKSRTGAQSEPLQAIKCWRITNFTSFQPLNRIEGKRIELNSLKRARRSAAAKEAEDETDWHGFAIPQKTDPGKTPCHAADSSAARQDRHYGLTPSQRGFAEWMRRLFSPTRSTEIVIAVGHEAGDIPGWEKLRVMRGDIEVRTLLQSFRIGQVPEAVSTPAPRGSLQELRVREAEDDAAVDRRRAEEAGRVKREAEEWRLDAVPAPKEWLEVRQKLQERLSANANANARQGPKPKPTRAIVGHEPG